jgi:hypothetical protein
LPSCLEETPLAGRIQYRVEELPICSTVDKPVAKLTQNRSIEARIGQIERESVLPDDAAGARVVGREVRSRIGLERVKGITYAHEDRSLPENRIH